jgi:hypothetical protein
VPFLITAVLCIATVALITIVGVGEVGGQRGWVAGVVFMALVLAVAVGVIRYVWRFT